MSDKKNIGYFSELFSSIQGEGGTVRGSCFGKRQIFIRFTGCNLADGKFDSSGCFWCDSLSSQNLKVDILKYEKIPGSKELLQMENPVETSKILEIVKRLITNDLHSISFTGGEPLLQLDLILNLANALKTITVNYPLFLETNGSICPDRPQKEKLGQIFEYCCCDIKDRSALAASLVKWKDLVNTEFRFIEAMVKRNVKTFAKLVVTAKTKLQDVKWISERLSKITFDDGYIVGLAIQPVNLEDPKLKEKYTISSSHLNEIFYTSAEFLPPESLTLSIQAHKYLNLL
jgi:organic radical activating enzyme